MESERLLQVLAYQVGTLGRFVSDGLAESEAGQKPDDSLWLIQREAERLIANVRETLAVEGRRAFRTS
jgi:hypothetical protein